MSGKSKEERKSFKPSARRPIRAAPSNNITIRPSETMPRYGLDDEDEAVVNSTRGYDVVDNVLSKYAESHNFQKLTQPRDINRRKSLSNLDAEDSNESSSVLSKSCPAYPTHSHCSQESEHENYEYNVSNESGHTSFGSNGNCSNEYIGSHCNYSNECSSSSSSNKHIQNLSTPKRTPKDWNLDKSQNNFVKNIFYIILVPIIGYFLVNMKLTELLKTSMAKDVTKSYDQVNFYNDLQNLGAEYNMDEDSILKVQIGISSIYEKQDAGSFMFVYNTKTSHLKEFEFNNFVNRVAEISAKYLRSKTTSISNTLLDSTNTGAEKSGDLIDKYREKLDKTGVMVVKEIDMLPADLAMAFHYYCDEHNPVVKKSAIFFTLNLANCSYKTDLQLRHSHIEKCLSSKWKSIPSENMGPLLTRVISVVIDVTNSF